MVVQQMVNFPFAKTKNDHQRLKRLESKRSFFFNLFDHPINMVLLGKIDGLIWYTIGCIIYLPIGWF